MLDLYLKKFKATCGLGPDSLLENLEQEGLTSRSGGSTQEQLLGWMGPRSIGTKAVGCEVT